MARRWPDPREARSAPDRRSAPAPRRSPRPGAPRPWRDQRRRRRPQPRGRRRQDRRTPARRRSAAASPSRAPRARQLPRRPAAGSVPDAMIRRQRTVRRSCAGQTPPCRSRQRLNAICRGITGATAPRPSRRGASRPASDQLAEGDRGVGHAAREAPLVVVPGHDAHEGAVQHLGLVHVEDRGVRVVVEVGRDQLLVV